ncbi:MAG: MFS transporter [Gammaproteobacteria bacterium]|nr:MFS transporter [Gammaproteobacteria bacterium]
MGQDSARVTMSRSEWQHTALVAGVFSTRTFGLFLLLPVLALYAAELPDATPVLVGLAVGGYGLTQALLQVPLGALSDRIGRRPVIAGGLAVFALGSAVAAASPGIFGIIAGRALQGAGAISGALSASLADFTRSEVRTRAMALVGAAMGVAFILAFAAAPPLAGVIGVRGLFWFAALLGGVALVTVLLGVPGGAPTTPSPRGGWRLVLRDWSLMRLNLGIALLHMVLTATFVTLPGVLRDELSLPLAQHGLMYLAALVLSLAIAVPMILASDGVRPRRELPMIGFGLLAVAQLWLANGLTGLAGMVLVITLFFAGFNFLEARLPAMLSQIAEAGLRGAALGLFGAAQFLGAFLGGLFGGLLLDLWHAEGVFTAAACASAVGALLLRQRRPG